MENKTLKEIQIKYLLSFYTNDNLIKQTTKDIDELYNKHIIIDSLITRGYSYNEMIKWSIDKLRKEHKNLLVEGHSAKDISDSLLFDILN
jgi:hypothetical protein